MYFLVVVWIHVPPGRCFRLESIIFHDTTNSALKQDEEEQQKTEVVFLKRKNEKDGTKK